LNFFNIHNFGALNQASKVDKLQYDPLILLTKSLKNGQNEPKSTDFEAKMGENLISYL
jgi:hypothetical protein